ncbi:MAG: LysE family transporter [Treponema sp.]|nr:LysE family transporter [Treponema sp.]
MPVAIIPSFLLYCFSCSITPGPANITSLAAALQYGKRTALRQWTGILSGFLIISLCSVFITYFLGTAFTPYVSKLSFIGAAYLLYLAVQMLQKSYADASGTDIREPNFFSGLILQLSNVKVMVYCLTCLASYVLPYRQDFASLLAVGALLVCTAPMANLVWIFAGSIMQRFFRNHTKAVNIIMALLLVACAASLVWGALFK